MIWGSLSHPPFLNTGPRSSGRNLGRGQMPAKCSSLSLTGKPLTSATSAWPMTSPATSSGYGPQVPSLCLLPPSHLPSPISDPHFPSPWSRGLVKIVENRPAILGMSVLLSLTDRKAISEQEKSGDTKQICFKTRERVCKDSGHI